MSADLNDETIMKSLAVLLGEWGYTRISRRQVLTAERDDNILKWVGIGITQDDESSRSINFNVGVRHQALERLVATLENREFDAVSPPTLCVQLGYLMPQHSFVEWRIDHHARIEQVLHDAVVAYRQFGEPFVEAHCSLTAMLDYLKNSKDQNVVPYQLPVAFLLSGDRKSAAIAVNQFLARASSGNHPADQEYRGFAARFLELLDA